MSTTEKPAVKTPKKATPTEYVVLYLNSDDGTWKEGARITTTGQTAAVKKYLENSKTATPALVAVPARSWQPVKPKTTTVTKTTLEAL